MAPQLTLYSNKGSPYGHYVEIALQEVGAEYSRFEVQIPNKPLWFAEKVNPVGKVPAITYGGPTTPADDPSPASHKLAESLVILEFIADIFPDSGLLPSDPLLRASVRFFINLVMNKLHPAYLNAMVNRGSPDHILSAVEQLQTYMPGGSVNDNKGPFLTGNTFSNADAVAAAYFIRLDRCLKGDIGSFAEGEGIKAYNVLHTSERYAQYRAYLSVLVERESVKGTYPEEEFLSKQREIFLSKRAPIS